MIYFRKIYTFSFILALMAVLPMCVCAQSGSDQETLNALFARMKTAQLANGKLSLQYTSEDLYHNQNFDKNGKKTIDDSAKYENVFIEGLPYRKLVEKNGKPLEGKDAEKEEKRYEKTVAERKKMTNAEKRGLLHWSFHTSMPICCLATLFDNKILRHEMLDGRDTLVVLSTPKPNAQPGNDEEKSSLDYKETTWIDVEDAMPAKIETELLKDKDHFKQGMILQVGFLRKVEAPVDAKGKEQAVWLQNSSVAHFSYKMMMINLSGTTVETWTNYKKFRVEVEIFMDEPETGKTVGK